MNALRDIRGLPGLLAVVVPALGIPANAGPRPVTVNYVLRELGAARWEYTYSIENIALAVPLEEFTIYFDADDYVSLALATPDPPAGSWSEFVVQPEPVLHDPGFYDALSRTGGIPAGETAAGFRVQFEWRGIGQPGAQPFEVVDPDTFAVLYAGATVPEPAALLLLGLGALLMCRARCSAAPRRRLIQP